MNLRDKDGKPHGFWKTHFSDSTVATTGYYIHGLREGPWVTYFNSGNISNEGEYKQGHRIGTWKYYWEGNIIAAIVNWNMDVYDGIYTQYSSKGIIEQTEFYARD